MGGQHSKGETGDTLYEETKRLLKPDQLVRLREAWHVRCRDADSINFTTFSKELFDDQVPLDAANALFDLFSQSEPSISYEQLVVGVALLCAASEERRRAFFQSNERCASALPIEWIHGPPTLDAVESAKVTSFYEVLAGVTHLDESEVADLEKNWPEIYDVSTCKLPRAKFCSLVSPPVPAYVVHQLFDAFDENGDDMIDFKELVCGLSASCRGPDTERYKFVFKVLAGRDGSSVSHEIVAPFAADASLATEDLTLGPFLTWTAESGALRDLLHIVAEIGHICLGLPPTDARHKKELILAYQSRMDVSEASEWYVLSRRWWDGLLRSNEDEPRPAAGDAQKVAPVDNADLLAADATHAWMKLTSITAEGGRLRHDLQSDKHIVPVSAALWTALCKWYTCKGPVLPRYVIEQPATPSSEGNACALADGTDGGAAPPSPSRVHTACRRTLELYPPTMVILRHASSGTLPHLSLSGASLTDAASTTVGWLKDTLVSSVSGGGPTYRRVPSFTATFSKTTTVRHMTDYLLGKLHLNAESARLWLVSSNGSSAGSDALSDMLLLEEHEVTLQQLGIDGDGRKILVETRQTDMTWPEEVMQLRDRDRGKAHSSRLEWRRLQLPQRGIVGLSNLGNTCFMNSALQCLSHTRRLTDYFLNERHLDELHKTKLAGNTKGQIALEYASLLGEMWDGNSKVVAPLKLRSAVNRHFSRFRNSSQHDAQEFLSILIDILHEDLNRFGHKSESGRKGSMAGGECQQLKDSDGRPDALVAQESWLAYTSRHSSVVTDAFLGQLKSEVRCVACGRTSARFDPFTCLSLPLPLEELVLLFVTVVTLDGCTPVRYGMRVPADRRSTSLSHDISRLCAVPAHNLLMLELNRSGRVLRQLSDYEQARNVCIDGGLLYAYELPRNAHTAAAAAAARRHERAETGGGLPCADAILRQPLPQDGAQLGANKTQLQLAVSCNGGGGGASTSECGSPSPAPTTGSDSGIGSRLPDSLAERASGSESGSGSATTPVTAEEDTARLDEVAVQLTSAPPARAPQRDAGAAADGGYALAVHRQIEYAHTFFLSYGHSKPIVFGAPMVVPLLPPGGWCKDGGADDNCDASSSASTSSNQVYSGLCGEWLYETVWHLVNRLIDSPVAHSPGAHANRARDVEDSYRYPYVIRLVDRTFMHCGKCPWHAMCRGCAVPLNASPLPRLKGCCLAVEWDAAALHLRYRHSSEMQCVDHATVASCAAEHTKPTSLANCLEQFTKSEFLGEGESVFCKHCMENKEATMKVDIWRPPPVLIVHLKRFVFCRDRWVKSSKRVHFDLVDTHTISRHVLCADYDKCAYACTAVVCHYGNIAQGHYVSFVRPSIGDSDAAALGDQWYVCNDSRVTPIAADQVDTANAYMMFLQRLPAAANTNTTRL